MDVGQQRSQANTLLLIEARKRQHRLSRLHYRFSRHPMPSILIYIDGMSDRPFPFILFYFFRDEKQTRSYHCVAPCPASPHFWNRERLNKQTELMVIIFHFCEKKQHLPLSLSCLFMTWWTLWILNWLIYTRLVYPWTLRNVFVFLSNRSSSSSWWKKKTFCLFGINYVVGMFLFCSCAPIY